MTGRRHTGRGDFDALSEAQIAAGRTARRRVGPAAAFRPARPLAVAHLLDAIQHVAEAATGERSFLHPRAGADAAPGRQGPPRSATGPA